MINSPPADPATTCKPAYVIDQSIQDGNLYKYTIDTDKYNIINTLKVAVVPSCLLCVEVLLFSFPVFISLTLAIVLK